MIHQQLERMMHHIADFGAVYVYMSKRINKEVEPGYLLGNNKRSVFGDVISTCNKLKIKFSSMIGYNVVGEEEGGRDKDVSVIETFISDCYNFKYDQQKRTFTGKIKVDKSDDIIVAFVLSVHLCQTYSDFAFQFKFSNTDTIPWYKIRY